MNPRVVGCGLNLLLSSVGAVAAAMGLLRLLPPEAPWVFGVFAGVGAFFVLAFLLAKLQTALFPHANVLRAREHERALREAPARACAESVVGSYVRLTGVLEAGEPLAASLTGRPCVAYRITRHGVSTGRNHHGSTKERQRGTRARLRDASGAIQVDLLGLMPTATGDALADSIALNAVSVMGERARLSPKIDFARASRAVWDPGGRSGAWPAGAPAPDHERLDLLSEQEGLGGRGTASWEEEILAPGDRVEIVGLVVEEAGEKLLSAPPNAQIHVRCV